MLFYIYSYLYCLKRWMNSNDRLDWLSDGCKKLLFIDVEFLTLFFTFLYYVLFNFNIFVICIEQNAKVLNLIFLQLLILLSVHRLFGRRKWNEMKSNQIHNQNKFLFLFYVSFLGKKNRQQRMRTKTWEKVEMNLIKN